MLTNKWLNQRYDVLNRRYFRNRLPKVPVKLVTPRGRWLGCTQITLDKSREPKAIFISNHLKTFFSLSEATLLHEMVHVEQHALPSRQAHGRKFQARMKDLAKRGAFKELW